MVVYFRSFGNHSNRLLQHASLSAFCARNNVKFVDLQEPRLMRPYGKRRRGLAGRLLFPPLALGLRALCRMGLLACMDLARDGGTGEFERRALSGRLCLVYGWGFSDPLGLKMYRGLFRDTFAVGLDSSWQKALEDRPVIGVHVRRGDYASFEGGRYFYSDEEYARVVEKARASLGIEGGRILIFSNDANLDIKAYEARLGVCLLSREAYQVDHELMSRCDYLIGPPSTFTQWASYLGSVPLYAIRDPEAEITRSAFKVFPETS